MGQKKDDSDPPPSPSTGSASKTTRRQEEAVHEDFHGKKFSNATHRSVTDADARLYKKSKGQEAYLCYLVHNVIDVTSGVILSTQVSMASGYGGTGNQPSATTIEFKDDVEMQRFKLCNEQKED
ncbi:hypothetical protein [Aneurinibacillus terranovensis]|uniref:hypothetical protein n=1 Tax=Aneurinibacillus terranovensis TaxID=278991 RepID=UPI001B7FC569